MVCEAADRISVVEGGLAGRFIEWEKCRSQCFDVPWWKRLLSTNELPEGDFREWFQHFWGKIRRCIFAIWRCDSEMFKAIHVLCVVDVEVEFEHGGGEK